MAARLCVEKPPPRTLGDDLESFVLVLLWLTCRHAANEMTPVERAMFLQQFDSLYGDPKANMFRSGSALVPTLKVPSKNFRYLLEDLLNGYRYRYTELGEREQQIPGKLEAHTQCQARLENHKWLMDLLTDALKAEEWKGGDPAREQDVAILFQRERGRKRKSACWEYELTNANKRLRLGEYARTEEDYEKVADEGGDDDDGNDEDDDDKGDDR